jgi:hypothetical protein
MPEGAVQDDGPSERASQHGASLAVESMLAKHKSDICFVNASLSGCPVSTILPSTSLT